MTDRLDGDCFLRRLVRAMGLKRLMCSSEGPGVCIEEVGSTSSDSSVMPSNVDALRVV